MSPHQQALGLRPAVPADLDAVADVMLAAMPRDPTWPYRFPYTSLYPEDTRKYTTMVLSLFIDPAFDDWEVMVVDAPSNEDPSVGKVVSFSVWDISFINRAKFGKGYEPQDPPGIVSKNGGSTRRDANPAHMKAFKEIGALFKKKYFLDVYGTQRVHLQILGTHPDYTRRGYATMLCEYGMSRAIEHYVVATLNASGEGFPLYKNLGYVDLGPVVFRVKGEEESVEVRAMVYEPHRGRGLVEYLS